MENIKQQYSELVSLTQLFLLRDYSLQDKKIADPQTYRYFQQLAIHSPSPALVSKKPVTLNANSRNPYQATTTPPNPVPQPDPLPPPSTPEPRPNPSIPEPTPPPAMPEPTPPTHTPDPVPPPATPDPRPPVITKTSSRKEFEFNLEPLSSAPSVETKEFREIIKQYYPTYPLRDQVPMDSEAIRRRHEWKINQEIPSIVILSFNDQDKQLSFLKNIVEAISLRLAPARLFSALKIEQEQKWESLLKAPTLRLIIASDYGLYMLPGLMKYYKETTKQAKHYLDQTPLLLLSDLSLYLKQPQLKPLLWRAICTEFEVNQSLPETKAR